jgi:hypothetical protein
MCRRNQLIGWVLLSLGLGMLIGLCLEAGFLASLAGIGLVMCGFRLICRR